MGSIVSKAHEMIKEHGSVENYIKSLQPNNKQQKAMNFKTFSVTDQNIEVCVHRDRGEDGKDFVLITAFVPDEYDSQIFEEETVSFTSESLIKKFISDFSEASAEAFVLDRMPIKD